MSERKNIDRLFQEKFKDFEANPANEVWGNIEAKLDEKKRRKVIPFWWKLSGVAAVFIIGFIITQVGFDGKIQPQNPVVIDTHSNPEKSDDNNTKEQPKIDPTFQPNQNTVVKSDETVPNTANQNNLQNNREKKINAQRTVNASNSTIAEDKSIKHRSLKNKLHSKEHKSSIGEASVLQSDDQWTTNHKNASKSTVEKSLVAVTSDKTKSDNTNLQTDNKNINLDALKGDNNSKVATIEKVEQVTDNASKKSVVKNELEELLNKKETQLPKESKLNRWQLTSNVAPIFLGSASNGSPIDSTLVNNSKSYNTSVGFGLGVSYAVNKKLSIRTGLNKFNMNYNTNDIVYFAGIDEARALKNVTPTAASAMIQIQSSATGHSSSLVPSETGLLPFEDSFVHKNKGYINQEMGYLEMPLEVTYALVDNRFGIKIIGGFSTLFLQDNNVSVVSDNRTTVLGEANNLNDIHFSTNIGLGLKYGFMKSFEFNIEPTFKYQLNTFSADAGNFKPYLFGVYSGISYKF
jgi:hypothetical protein